MELISEWPGQCRLLLGTVALLCRLLLGTVALSCGLLLGTVALLCGLLLGTLVHLLYYGTAVGKAGVEWRSNWAERWRD